jgi:ArsR family metal-binding transcriptional regulator
MSVTISGAIAALTGFMRSVFGNDIAEYSNKWIDPAQANKNRMLVLSDGSSPGGDAAIIIHAVCFITLTGKKAEDLPEQQLAVEEKLWAAVLYGEDVPAPVYRTEIKRVEHYAPLPGAPCVGITEVGIDLAINYL